MSDLGARSMRVGEHLYGLRPGEMPRKPDRPHIVIGQPTGDLMCVNTKSDMSRLVENSRGLLVKQIEVMGTYLSHTHNDLVRNTMFDPPVEKILFVDCDMRFPPDGMRRLDEHDLDVVGCTYRKRRARQYEQADGTIGLIHDMMINRFPDREYPRRPEPLEEWTKIPSGFMLVKTRVFRKIGWPWFFETYGEAPEPPLLWSRSWIGKPDDFVGTDYNFCFKAREAGFKIWCDLDLSREVRHLGETELEFEWPEE